MTQATTEPDVRKLSNAKWRWMSERRLGCPALAEPKHSVTFIAKQTRALGHLSMPGPGIRRSLQQTEFLGAADGRTAIVYPQLPINVIGMGAQRVERHD